MKFIRLYSGDDGESHFEELEPTGSALFSKLESATAVVFKDNPAPHLVEWHPAPRRQYMITLSGSVEIRIGDGTVKTFGPGDVLLAEDVTGRGHVAVAKNWVRAFIHLG